MSLFQKSVIKNYLAAQDKTETVKAFERFNKYFGNAARIANIKLLKEENYQEGFLRELFVEVFGYTLNPDTDYNLTTEFKNETDAKKADGAILTSRKALGVIELKSTKTLSLDSITNQAFNYKNHHAGCRYVITSNFEKLRFYIDNATEYEEFDLFHILFSQFELLYLLLNKNAVLNNLPLKIKEESKLHEQNVSDQLYKDYRSFKNKVFENLVLRNPQYDKLTLFKKSQKLLDRILFILFAEDSGLVPPNAVSIIVEQWETLKELDEAKPLYERFIKFFSHLNTGHSYKNFELPGYNGGLFKEDDVLDNVIIDDDILHNDVIKLSTYDFSSEVDVNILGHIFEHSLTEIEEKTAELEGAKIDPDKTRRKKEGVYYTPKYITKYIVDNTLGALCNEKKEELGLNNIDEAVITNPRKEKSTLSKEAKKYFDVLDKYREYLLGLKILDPACGSGAFLNQALEFLINEHRYIDELQALLLNQPLVIQTINASILEHNIYGVDINEEAVEIARLSLWLRTAERGRKLSDLSKNIKCGNSLIDDPSVAGDKAFDWNKEFRDIMKDGGFDVVIGNPPYVKNELIPSNIKRFFEITYSSYSGKADLYVYFIEKSILLCKGQIGLITSSKYTKVAYGKNLIDLLNKKTSIKYFIDLKDFDVFNKISAYPSILILSKSIALLNKSILLIPNENNYEDLNSQGHIRIEVEQDNIFNSLGGWNTRSSSSDFEFLNKLLNLFPMLSEYGIKPFVGIKTGFNEAYIINNEKRLSFYNSSQLAPYILGKDVKRYSPLESNRYIILPYHFIEGKLKLLNVEHLHKEILQWLERYQIKLEHRAIIKNGLLNGTKKWYEFQQIKTDFDFREFIIYPDISEKVNFTLAKNTIYDMTCFGLNSNSVSLLTILNSKLISFVLNHICVKARGGYLRLKNQYILNIPLPHNYSLLDYIDNNLIELNKQLNGFKTALDNLWFNNFHSKYKISKLILEDFHIILDVFKKQKIKLTLKQQEEWEEYFNEKKNEILEIKKQIEETDNRIDIMVYKLYNLTYDEIKIVDPDINKIILEEKYDNFKIAVD